MSKLTPRDPDYYQARDQGGKVESLSDQALKTTEQPTLESFQKDVARGEAGVSPDLVDMSRAKRGDRKELRKLGALQRMQQSNRDTRIRSEASNANAAARADATAQKQLQAQQVKLEKEQRARQLRQGKAAGIETKTDVETGETVLSRHEDGSYQFKPGKVGLPQKREDGVWVQRFRDDRNDVFDEPVETEIDPDTGDVYFEKDDPTTGKTTREITGKDENTVKNIRFDREKAHLDLQQNKLAQERAEFEPTWKPIEAAYKTTQADWKKWQEDDSEDFTIGADGRPKQKAPFGSGWVDLDETAKEDYAKWTEERNRLRTEAEQAKRKWQGPSQKNRALEDQDLKIKRRKMEIDAQKARLKWGMDDKDDANYGVDAVRAAEEMELVDTSRNELAGSPEPSDDVVRDAALAIHGENNPDPAAAVTIAEAADKDVPIHVAMKAVTSRMLAQNLPKGANRSKIEAGIRSTFGDKLYSQSKVTRDGDNAFRVTFNDGRSARISTDKERPYMVMEDSDSFDLIDTWGQTLPVYTKHAKNIEDRKGPAESARWINEIMDVIVTPTTWAESQQLVSMDGQKVKTTDLTKGIPQKGQGETPGEQGPGDAYDAMGTVTMSPSQKVERLNQMGAAPGQILQSVKDGELPWQYGELAIKKLYGQTMKVSMPSEEGLQKFVGDAERYEQANLLFDHSKTSKQLLADARASGDLDAIKGVKRAYGQHWARQNRHKPGMTADKIREIAYSHLGAGEVSPADFIIDGTMDNVKNIVGSMWGIGGGAVGMLWEGFTLGDELNDRNIEATGEWFKGLRQNLVKYLDSKDGKALHHEMASDIAAMAQEIDNGDGSTESIEKLEGIAKRLQDRAYKFQRAAHSETTNVTPEEFDLEQNPEMAALVTSYRETADPELMVQLTSMYLKDRASRAYQRRTAALSDAAGGEFWGAVAGGATAGFQELGIEMASALFTMGVAAQIFKPVKHVAKNAMRGSAVAGSASRVSRMTQGAFRSMDSIREAGLITNLSINSKNVRRLQKGWNMAMQTAKVGIGSAPSEAIEEGIAELGNPDMTKDSFIHSMAIGAAAGPLMAPVMIAMTSPIIVGDQRRYRAQKQEARVKLVDEYNRVMADTDGFKPITVEQVGIAEAIVANEVLAASQEAYAASFTNLQHLTREMVEGNPTPEVAERWFEAQVDYEEATANLVAERAGALEALNEVRELDGPAMDRVVALAKVQAGNADQLTSRERSRLMDMVKTSKKTKSGSESDKASAGRFVEEVSPGVWKITEDGRAYVQSQSPMMASFMDATVPTFRPESAEQTLPDTDLAEIDLDAETQVNPEIALDPELTVESGAAAQPTSQADIDPLDQNAEYAPDLDPVTDVAEVETELPPSTYDGPIGAPYSSPTKAWTARQALADSTGRPVSDWSITWTDGTTTPAGTKIPGAHRLREVAKSPAMESELVIPDELTADEIGKEQIPQVGSQWEGTGGTVTVRGYKKGRGKRKGRKGKKTPVGAGMVRVADENGVETQVSLDDLLNRYMQTDGPVYRKPTAKKAPVRQAQPAAKKAATGQKTGAKQSKEAATGQKPVPKQGKPSATGQKAVPVDEVNDPADQARRIVAAALNNLRARFPNLPPDRLKNVPDVKAGAGIGVDYNGVISYDPARLVELVLAVPEASRALRIESVLDEELTHAAQVEAVRRIVGTAKLTEKQFEAYYKKVWKEMGQTPGLQDAVSKAYQNKRSKAVLAAEGIRMFIQLKARGEQTEMTRLMDKRVGPMIKEIMAKAIAVLKEWIGHAPPSGLLADVITEAENVMSEWDSRGPEDDGGGTTPKKPDGPKPAPPTKPAPPVDDLGEFGNLADELGGVMGVDPDAAAAPPAVAAPPETAAAPPEPIGEPVPDETALGEGDFDGIQFDGKIELSELDPKSLTLSADVPQFKEGADSKGIVEPIKGKINPLGMGPIVVWERENGDLEIVTGRHRWQAHVEQEIATIPAQVVREADGFTADMARILDAELNIRDNQGSPKDFVRYFSNAENLTREEAVQRGLVRGAKAEAAADIVFSGSPETLEAFLNDKIRPRQAAEIARTAPGNASVQRLGLKHLLEGNSGVEAAGLMRASMAVAGGDTAVQGDLFGQNDDALKQAVAAAKFAGKQATELRKDIASVSGAVKDPARAAKMGVNVDDAAAVQAKLVDLRDKLGRWKEWHKHSDLRNAAFGQDPTALKDSLGATEPVEEEAPDPGAGTPDMFGAPEETVAPEEETGEEIDVNSGHYDGGTETVETVRAAIEEARSDLAFNERVSISENPFTSEIMVFVKEVVTPTKKNKWGRNEITRFALGKPSSEAEAELIKDQLSDLEWGSKGNPSKKPTTLDKQSMPEVKSKGKKAVTPELGIDPAEEQRFKSAEEAREWALDDRSHGNENLAAAAQQADPKEGETADEYIARIEKDAVEDYHPRTQEFDTEKEFGPDDPLPLGNHTVDGYRFRLVESQSSEHLEAIGYGEFPATTTGYHSYNPIGTGDPMTIARFRLMTAKGIKNLKKSAQRMKRALPKKGVAPDEFPFGVGAIPQYLGAQEFGPDVAEINRWPADIRNDLLDAVEAAMPAIKNGRPNYSENGQKSLERLEKALDYYRRPAEPNAGFSLESVTDDEITAEENKKRLQDKAAAPMKGTAGDLTADMFGEGETPLFNERRDQTTEPEPEAAPAGRYSAEDARMLAGWAQDNGTFLYWNPVDNIIDMVEAGEYRAYLAAMADAAQEAGSPIYRLDNAETPDSLADRMEQADGFIQEAAFLGDELRYGARYDALELVDQQKAEAGHPDSIAAAFEEAVADYYEEIRASVSTNPKRINSTVANKDAEPLGPDVTKTEAMSGKRPSAAEARLEEWRQLVKDAKSHKHGDGHSNVQKIILSLFDSTGAWSKPWRDAGYMVIQIDKSIVNEDGTGHEMDVLQINQGWLQDNGYLGEYGEIHGVLAAPPCTTFTLSANRWGKYHHGTTPEARQHFAKTFGEGPANEKWDNSDSWSDLFDEDSFSRNQMKDHPMVVLVNEFSNQEGRREMASYAGIAVQNMLRYGFDSEATAEALDIDQVAKSEWDDIKADKVYGPQFKTMIESMREKAGYAYPTMNDYTVAMVNHTVALIEYLQPDFWALENPKGKMKDQTDVPVERLHFQPHVYGDPFTKETQIFGRFNADLPTANVKPTGGSYAHNKSGNSKSEKKDRSNTFEGFSLAFFVANHGRFGPPVEDAVAEQLEENLDKAKGNQALVYESGMSRAMSAAVEDSIKNHRPIGISLFNQPSEPMRRKMTDYVATGGRLFVDNGAFSAYKGKGYKPETLEEAQARYNNVQARYNELLSNIDTDSLPLVTIVAPDAIGNPAATKALVAQYYGDLAPWAAKGVNVITPIQRPDSGALDETQFEEIIQTVWPDFYTREDLTKAFPEWGWGMPKLLPPNMVIGIPYNKESYSAQEVYDWLNSTEWRNDTPDGALNWNTPQSLMSRLQDGVDIQGMSIGAENKHSFDTVRFHLLGSGPGTLQDFDQGLTDNAIAWAEYSADARHGDEMFGQYEGRGHKPRFTRQDVKRFKDDVLGEYKAYEWDGRIVLVTSGHGTTFAREYAWKKPKNLKSDKQLREALDRTGGKWSHSSLSSTPKVRSGDTQFIVHSGYKTFRTQAAKDRIAEMSEDAETIADTPTDVGGFEGLADELGELGLQTAGPDADNLLPFRRNERFNRIPEEVAAEGLGKAGPLAEAAVGFLERVHETGASQFRTGGQRAEAAAHEASEAQAWALDNEVWIDPGQARKVWEAQGEVGEAEHRVWFGGSQEIFKSFHFPDYLDSDFHTLLAYWDRILAHNAFFPEAPYNFRGYTKDPGGNGRVVPVFAQPAYKGKAAEPATVYNHMVNELAAEPLYLRIENLDFTLTNDPGTGDQYDVYGFLSPMGVMISDVSGTDNVRVTPDGDLVFIDPMIVPSPEGAAESFLETASEGYEEQIDPDMMPAVMGILSKMAKAGLNDPVTFGKVVDRAFKGQGRKYTNRLWDGLKMVSPTTLPDVDWNGVYGQIDGNEGPTTPNTKPPSGDATRNDGGTADTQSGGSGSDLGQLDGTDDGGGNSGSGRSRGGRPATEDAGEQRGPGTRRTGSGSGGRSARPQQSERSDDSGGDGSTSPAPRSTVEAVDKQWESQTTLEKGAVTIASLDPDVRERRLKEIKEEIPALLPEQVEDVLHAELRHRDSGKPGMLFTNGTGTGKTFTGLAIAQRAWNRGARNILIVSPNKTISEQFVDAGGRFFNFDRAGAANDVELLPNTKSSGEAGVVVTTYANLIQNNELISKKWDMIIADESHKFMAGQTAKPTKALGNFYGLSRHPRFGARAAVQREYWERYQRIEEIDIERKIAKSYGVDAQSPGPGIRRKGELEEDIATLKAERVGAKAGLLLSIDGKIHASEMERDMITHYQDTLEKEGRSVVIAAYNELKQEKLKLNDEINARIAELQKEYDATPEAERTKVVFLTATPFLYRETLVYAESYLFDFPEENKATVGSYGHASPEQEFYIQNFGYRIRTGKLTQPENENLVGALERRFSDEMQETGAMRGRKLVSDKDYSRDFVKTPDIIGNKIDEFFSLVIRGESYPALRRPRFEGDDPIFKIGEWHERMQLLEGIKIQHAMKRADKHIKLGRQVVIFHNFNKGEPRNVLRPTRDVSTFDEEERAQFDNLLEELGWDYGQAVNALDGLTRPIDAVNQYYGDRAGMINGQVSSSGSRARKKVIDDWQDNDLDVLLVQIDAGGTGLNLHDISGVAQRAMINIGIPFKPSDAIQSEGRTYRVGVKSDAIFEYLTTGTNLELWTYGQTVSRRTGTAENLALGSQSRQLKESFSEGYLDATEFAPHNEQGKGGKEKDKRADEESRFDMARALYTTNRRRTKATKSYEGIDYFATPEPLGMKMVDWLQPRPGESALEPSGGHGAIARFFPDHVVGTAIEPSPTLHSRLQIANPLLTLKEGTFEELHAANKYDVIAMNPPYGKGGSTAAPHVLKAMKHAADGGRVAAILPEGPAMDTRLEKIYATPAGQKMVLRMEIKLPAATFDRAGTNVWTRLLIWDKIERSRHRQAYRTKVGPPEEYTLTSPQGTTKQEQVQSFFGDIENIESPSRPEPADIGPVAEPSLQTAGLAEETTGRIESLQAEIDRDLAMGLDTGAQEAELEEMMENAESYLQGMDEADPAEQERADEESDTGEFEAPEQMDVQAQLLQSYRDYHHGTLQNLADEGTSFPDHAREVFQGRIKAGTTDEQINAGAKELFDRWSERRAAATPLQAATPETTPFTDADVLQRVLKNARPIYAKVMQLAIQDPTKTADVIAGELNVTERLVHNVIGHVTSRYNALKEAAAGPLEPEMKTELDEDGNPVQKIAGGRPDLAHGADTQMARVDQLRNEAGEPARMSWEEVNAEARERLAADYKGIYADLIKKSRKGSPYDQYEVAMAKIIISTEGRNLRYKTAEERVRLIELHVGYREAGTEAARALAIRRDPSATPAERVARMAMDVLFTPDKSIQKQIDKSATEEERQGHIRMWSNRIEGLKQRMAADGVDIDGILESFYRYKEATAEARDATPEVANLIQIRLKELTGREKSLILSLMDRATGKVARSQVAMGGPEAKAAYGKFWNYLLRVGQTAMRAAEQTLLEAAGVFEVEDELLDNSLEGILVKMGLPHPDALDWGSKEVAPPTIDDTRPTEPIAPLEPVIEPKPDAPIKPKPGGKKDTRPEPAAQDLSDPETEESLADAAARARGKNAARVIEYWRQSILSGPKTHAVNMISGVAFGSYDFIHQRFLQATVNDVLGIMNEKWKTADMATWRDVPGMAKHLMKAARQAGINSSTAWRTESRVYEAYANDREIDKNAWGFKNEDNYGRIPGTFGKVMRGISYRPLTWADEFIKTFFGELEAAAQAHRIAWIEEGLRGEEYKARFDKLMVPGSVAYQRSVAESERITFQTPMNEDGRSLLNMIDAGAQIVNRAKRGRAGKYLNFVVPFVNTPANIFRIGIEMSPIGTLVTIGDTIKGIAGHANDMRLYGKKNGKKLEGEELAQVKAFAADRRAELVNRARYMRDLTHQAIAWGLYFALADFLEPQDDDDGRPMITGSSPWYLSSRGERDAQYRSVMPPQSIRIGDTVISYKRIEPFATALSATVDLIASMQSDYGNAEKWGAYLAHVKGQVSEKTFLQGISDLMRAWEDPQHFAQGWLANISSGFVPNLIRQPIREADKNIRDTRPDQDSSWIEAYSQALGYRIVPQWAPKRFDLWGRPVLKNPGQKVAGYEPVDYVARLVLPTTFSFGAEVDPLDVWIVRYNQVTTEPANRIKLTPIDRRLSQTIKGKQVSIMLNEAEAERINQIAGRAARQALGNNWNIEDRPVGELDARLIIDTVRHFQKRARDLMKQKKGQEIYRKYLEQ